MISMRIFIMWKSSNYIRWKSCNYLGVSRSKCDPTMILQIVVAVLDLI